MDRLIPTQLGSLMKSVVGETEFFLTLFELELKLDDAPVYPTVALVHPDSLLLHWPCPSKNSLSLITQISKLLHTPT
jgi:hypothetical protein